MTLFVERLRALEERCLAAKDAIRCPVHLCFGQEVVPEALHATLRTYDWLFSTHRSHGHYLAKGGSEARLWDEIMGLETGVNGGFAGSQCFSDPALNFHSSAVVGGLVGVAAGTALALKLSGSQAIAVCCVGDAVAEQGVFWETVNFAALKRLPLLIVCENNGYSVHVPIAERQVGDISLRVQAFGVPAFFNVEAGVRYAREGYPAFVEMQCSRDCSHIIGMGDYR